MTETGTSRVDNKKPHFVPIATTTKQQWNQLYHCHSFERKHRKAHQVVPFVTTAKSHHCHSLEGKTQCDEAIKELVLLLLG